MVFLSISINHYHHDPAPSMPDDHYCHDIVGVLIKGSGVINETGAGEMDGSILIHCLVILPT